MFDEFGWYRCQLTAQLTNFFECQGDDLPPSPDEDNLDRAILHAHCCELTSFDEMWVQTHTIEAFPTTQSQAQKQAQPPPAPDPDPLPILPEPPLPEPEPPPLHSSSPHSVNPKEPDYKALRCFFG